MGYLKLSKKEKKFLKETLEKLYETGDQDGVYSMDVEESNKELITGKKGAVNEAYKKLTGEETE